MVVSPGVWRVAARGPNTVRAAVLWSLRFTHEEQVVSREQELVQRFATKDGALDALRGLTGGVTATHLRRVQLDQGAFDALVGGLSDVNPRIRWWCIQVLDHVPDPRAAAAVLPLLDDPVPRVRRNAAHALGCVACKPSVRLVEVGQGDDVATALARVVADDPNEKVRAEARRALAARGAAPAPTS
jgi:HEAT repeat protein